jgi:hypothetical protein
MQKNLIRLTVWKSNGHPLLSTTSHGFFKADDDSVADFYNNEWPFDFQTLWEEFEGSSSEESNPESSTSDDINSASNDVYTPSQVVSRSSSQSSDTSSGSLGSPTESISHSPPSLLPADIDEYTPTDTEYFTAHIDDFFNKEHLQSVTVKEETPVVFPLDVCPMRPFDGSMDVGAPSAVTDFMVPIKTEEPIVTPVPTKELFVNNNVTVKQEPVDLEKLLPSSPEKKKKKTPCLAY